MTYFGQTDIGKKRKENQDCFGALPLCKEEMILFAVCDGMGGEKGGATASALTLSTFLSYCEKNITDASAEDVVIRAALSGAVREANHAVFAGSSSDESLTGMGSTLVAALCFRNRRELFLVNVGDSRAYFCTNTALTQISHDHSFVQYLVDLGELSPGKAAHHPKRNLLMKAVGVEETLPPDIDRISFPQDTDGCTYLLLCSDGLHGYVRPTDIQKQILHPCGLEEKVDGLVSLANQKSGADNITAMLISL